MNPQAEDEWGSYLQEQMRDSEFAATFRDVEVRLNVVDALVRSRLRAGLTQGQVAQRVGVGQPTISEFESGQSDPRLSTLQRYARAVEVQLQVFVAVPGG